ncbi:MAG: preprotein translocase subunit SecG [Candidatus Pacebacteria bacterium]|nr:preprotein translocase subunit SecG [Candidatus Paceibacterota bacterium]
MNQIDIAQAVIAVLLIVSILLQNRGTGLSETFGGDSGNSSYQTKRGFDKFLFRASIVIAVAFLGIAIYRLMQGI